MSTLSELSIIETFDLINKDKKLSKQILVNYINNINENDVNMSSLFNCIKKKNNKFKLYLSNTVLKYNLDSNISYKDTNDNFDKLDDFKPIIKPKITTKLNQLKTNVITKEQLQEELDNMINSLSNEQLHAFECMQTGRNLFITGSAGTGKSHIIKTIIKNFNFSKLC